MILKYCWLTFKSISQMFYSICWLKIIMLSP